jgi:hypothetical protein
MPRLSTEKEVRAAIDSVLDRCPLNFGADWTFARTASNQNLIRDLAENGCTVLNDAISGKRIIIQREACASINGSSHHDASVSALNRQGAICLSTDRLELIAPSELVGQVSSLIAHEVTHLLGHDEVSAQYIQRYYLDSHTDSNGPVSRAIAANFRKAVWSLLDSRLIDSQILTKKLASAENARALLASAGVSCTQSDGSPRTDDILSATLSCPETQARLGFNPGWQHDEKKFREWLELSREIMVYTNRPTLARFNNNVDGFMANCPCGLGECGPQEQQRTKIKAIVEEIVSRWLSDFPEDTDSKLTVCDVRGLENRIFEYQRLNAELKYRTHAVLQFD